MIDFELLKCAFNHHKLSEPFEDSLMGWIRICKKCGHTIKIPCPQCVVNNIKVELSNNKS